MSCIFKNLLCPDTCGKCHACKVIQLENLVEVRGITEAQMEEAIAATSSNPEPDPAMAAPTNSKAEPDPSKAEPTNSKAEPDQVKSTLDAPASQDWTQSHHTCLGMWGRDQCEQCQYLKAFASWQ